MFRWILPILTLAIATGTFSPLAFAHQGETHNDGVTVPGELPQQSDNLPIDVGGEFELVDHNGAPVNNHSYAGKHMLVFFGYTQCKNMCSLTLTRVGKAMEILGDKVDRLYPVVITVDPDRDTPEVLKSELFKYHPSLIGHTGSQEQLQRAYDNFNQEPESAGTDWNDDPIVSHSSYIFLMDQNGEFVTLFPPILNPQSMADIISKYVDGTS